MVDSLVGPHRGRDEGNHKPAGHAHTRVAATQAAHSEPVRVHPETEAPSIFRPKHPVDAPALNARGLAQQVGAEYPTIEEGLVERGEAPGASVAVDGRDLG